MNVIKKLGYRQEYDINKIKDALQRTAKTINIKFTASDWREIKPRILSRLEPIMNDKEEIYFWEIDDVVMDALLRSRFKEIAKEYIQTRSREKEDKLNDLGLTPLAMWLLKERYLRKDENGNPIETAREMMCRVATAIASSEDNGKREYYTDKFKDMLCNLDFLPNSPCLASAGTDKKGTLLACFGMIPGDSIDSIFETAKTMAKTFQMGGGVGLSVSDLREEGAYIKSSHGTSSGPVEFLKLYDVVVEIIKSGGFRRGALLTLMDYNTPDIEKFIHCKRNVNKLNRMNISILIKDDLFKKLKNNEEIELISPSTNKKVKNISAQLMLEMIATNMWETGEPGLLFYESINKANPTPHLGEIRICNPCLTGDTLIMTDCGWMRIKDLAENDYGLGISLDTRFNYERLSSDKFKAFKTGRKQIYDIKTKEGYSIKSTDNHQVMTPNGWKMIKDLNVGDKVHIGQSSGAYHLRGNEVKGRILGWLVGDGWISGDRGTLGFWGDDIGIVANNLLDDVNSILKRKIKIHKGNPRWTINSCHIKRLAETWGINKHKQFTCDCIISASDRFQRGFLQSLFTADGSVQGNHNKGNSVRLAQSNLELLKNVQLMLLNFGIYSKIYKNRRLAKKTKLPDGRGGHKEYDTKAQHELVISRFSMAMFYQNIGFLKDSRKQRQLKETMSNYKKTPYNSKFIATVESVTDVGIEDVYDITEPETNSFIANGIVVHNCGEATLLSGEACCLGSINLLNHIEDREINWDKLAETTKLAIRFLDNILTTSPYPSKEIEKKVKNTRKVGLGIMGFADMLIELGIKYSSKDAVSITNKVISFINDVASQESVELGKEKGLYPAYKDGYRKRRNSIVTTIAPTGTLSIIANVSSGIEPNFPPYTRVIDNKLVEVIPRYVGNEYFETTYDIPFEQHLSILSEAQKYVENAISKTCNVPESTTVQEIKDIIIKAHKLGCKGLTVYRQNCDREPLMRCEECRI